jgi:transcriptional regulator with XRE-family HTH domain
MGEAKVAKGPEDNLATTQATMRFKNFVEFLGEQGFTQTQIATKAGFPPQYLSDIKRDRRPVTELVARRLGEAFDVNFEWLLGISDSRETSGVGTAGTESGVFLPLLPHPIEGEPRTHPKWDGACFEVTGFALAKLSVAKLPYILRFGHDDTQGRLRCKDLILISQVSLPEAEIHVVRTGKKSRLARKGPQGGFICIADGSEIPSEDALVTGHCVGIVWASLL